MVIFHSYVSLPEGISSGYLTWLWKMDESGPFIDAMIWANYNNSLT
jgi:hypothetical protein